MNKEINNADMTIDEASDDEIARRMINQMSPTGITVDLCVERRFAGSRPIGRGLPFGIGVDGQSRPILEKLALIRVQPNEHIAIAKKLIHKNFSKAISIGIAAGIVVAIISNLFFQRYFHVQPPLPLQITLPCRIQEISTKSITCAIGSHRVDVMVNDFFPSTSLRLTEVFRDRSGFAVNNKEQQTIFFVVNNNLTLKGNTK